MATWRHRGGLAAWSFDLRDAPADGHRWLRDTAVAVAGLLEGFAAPVHAELTTEAAGDIDEPGALPPDDPIAALRAALDAHRDPVAVRLELALLLTLEPGGPVQRHGAGFLLVELDHDRDAAPYIHLYLSVDVDIYAEWTYGDERDNRVLARVNGPRLTRFLQRLQHELGAVPADIDASSYPGQLTADGFRLTGA
jgi:hypothetical protein